MLAWKIMKVRGPFKGRIIFTRDPAKVRFYRALSEWFGAAVYRGAPAYSIEEVTDYGLE